MGETQSIPGDGASGDGRPPEPSSASPLRVFLDSANIECKPNSILSSRVLTYLQRNGHQIVTDLRQAQLVICNTCGFNDEFANLSKALLARYDGSLPPEARIICVGCLGSIRSGLAQEFSRVLVARDPRDLDGLLFRRVKFGDIRESYVRQSDLPRLASYGRGGLGLAGRLLLAGAAAVQRGLQALVPEALPEAVVSRLVLDEVTCDNKVYVEIGRGCAGNCSYCVIKKAKGQVVSRSSEAILADVDAVAEPGKSLYLVADDCGSYGLDTGESLIGLIRAISRKHPALPIDVCYLGPRWLEQQREAYEALFAEGVVGSVNIPIQSGSQRIVGLMNRDYSVDTVLDIVRQLRRLSPRTLLLTHVIVGFPGETAGDYRSTLRALDAFDFWWGFGYTDHPDMPASALPGKVSRWTVGQRSLRLRFWRAARHFRRLAVALTHPARRNDDPGSGNRRPERCERHGP